ARAFVDLVEAAPRSSRTGPRGLGQRSDRRTNPALLGTVAMTKPRLKILTAASILAGATHGAIAQTQMPQSPTTKILAVGTLVPRTEMSKVQRILPSEVRETAQLYLDGKIDQ